MRTPAGPIRAELFSAEHLEQFAGTLAAEQVVHPRKRRGRRLLPRLRENARVLVRVAPGDRGGEPPDPRGLSRGRVAAEQLPHRRGAGSRDPGGPPAGVLSGAAQARLRAARRLSRASTGWPGRSSRTPTAGSSSRRSRRFVRAYQRVQPLTIGELWALAISLRVVLVENLRRLAERIAARSVARDQADAIADALLGTGGTPKPEPAAVLQMLEQAPFSQAFAVQLVQRLREQDPAVTPALEWLDRRLAREGTTAEDIVHVEHQAQIANHATVRNVITSMRLLSSADWADFFESVSLVHEALCEGTRVAEMDFPTRDRYRHAVEELSRGSPPRRARGGAARGGHGGEAPRREETHPPRLPIPASGTPATTSSRRDAPDSSGSSTSGFRSGNGCGASGFGRRPRCIWPRSCSRRWPCSRCPTALTALAGVRRVVGRSARSPRRLRPRPTSRSRSSIASSRGSWAPGASRSSSSRAACRPSCARWSSFRCF